MKTREIIVIGGGLGGLSAAALLAQAGRRVRVLEAATRVGGRGRSREQDGFVLNQGAHALYRGGTAASVLRVLGVRPRGRKVGGKGAFLSYGERVRPMPQGALALCTSDMLSAQGKWALLRILATVGERRARAYRGRSVAQWLDAEAPDASARAMLEMFIRLTSYVHAPEQLSAELALRQLGSGVRHGVMYVDGGWQSLVDALERRARELGVAIEVGAQVAAIEHGAGVEAVRLSDGRSFHAAGVVAAVEPSTLAALLPGDASAKAWADAAVPVRAACLELGVRELAHPERANVQATDAPLYFSNHSVYAELAPAGHQTLHLARYLAPGEDGRDKEPELRAFLERVQPGAYERARTRRFTPHYSVYNAMPGCDRAPCRHPQIEGLQLVGDWVDGGELLLDGVLASARTAAQALARFDVASTLKARDTDRAA